MCWYNRIKSTKSPASGTGNVSESRLMSQVGEVREVVFVRKSVCLCVRAVEVPVLVCFGSGCSHVTEVGGGSRGLWEW